MINKNSNYFHINYYRSKMTSSVKSNQKEQNMELKAVISISNIHEKLHRDNKSMRQDDIHTRKQIIKMLICIIIIFFISWTPIT